jgi:hypothetical protein
MLLAAMPAYGGWWTNIEGESWCHRVEEHKYCLPATFELVIVEDAFLEFQSQHVTTPSIFANYMGNETLEEVLADSSIIESVTTLSDTYINDMRIIRQIASEENHSIVFVLVVFSDDSVVRMFGGEETEFESALSEFIQSRNAK